MKKFTAFLSVLALLASCSVPLSAEVVSGDRTDSFSVDSATTYTVNDGGSYTFSGVISGSGSITKDGPGTLTLSGNNSNSGALTINGGTLNMNNYGKYGSLNVISGTVNINKGYKDNNNIAIPQNSTVTVGSATTTATLNLNATYSFDQHTTFTLYKGSTVNLIANGQPQNFAWGGNGIIFEGGGTITGSGMWQQGALYNAKVNGANATVEISCATIDLHGDQSINVVDASSVMTISSSIRGAGWGLTKNGAGRLSITGTSTHSKGVTVNAGTLALSGHAWTTPSLFTVKSGATLELGTGASISNLSLAGTMNLLDSVNVTGTMEVPTSATGAVNIPSGKSLTVQGAFSGSGTLNKTGSGSLSFTDPSAFTGTLNIKEGSWTVPAGQTWNAAATVTVASGNLTIKDGATTPALTIAGTNTTFEGAATVSGGITLSADSTLNIQPGKAVNVSGALAGAGKKLTKTGTGSLNFTGSGTGTVGGTKVAAGILSFSGSEKVTFDSQYGNSSALIISGSTANTAELNVSGNASVTVNNGWLTVGLNANEKGTVNVSSGNLTVNNQLVVGENGAGILNISGGTMKVTGDLWNSNGTGGGTVTISNGGKLEIGNANLSVRGKSVINVDGGTFQVNNTLNVVDSIVASGSESTINIKSGLLSAKNINFTVMNNSSYGTGTLNLLGGTLSVSGTVLYSNSNATAKVNFGQGTYKQTTDVTWANQIGINFNGRNATSTADVEDGKTVIDVASGKTLTIPGTLSGVGGFQKTSTGTLTISGANSFSGGVDVLNGTLKLTGSSASVLGFGTVQVGDGTAGQSALLSLKEFTGKKLTAESLEVGSNGTIDLKVTKTADGYTVTSLDFASADLDGKLNLTFDSGVILTGNEGVLGKIFPETTAIQGDFASVSTGNAVPYGYKLSFSAADGTVAMTLVPEPSTWVLLLLGAGLFGAFEVRRSAKRRTQASAGDRVQASAGGRVV